MLVSTSCSTSTKFTIYGDPGTQILTPSKTTLATIDNTGKVKIKNSDDDYYAFLLSHKPGTAEYIPFALDYNKKTYTGSKLAYGLGLGLAALGSTALIIGTIGVLCGEEDLAIPLIAMGGVVDLAGISIGMPGNSRSDQTNHEYRYKYISVQKTNQDIQFTKPNFDVPKNAITERLDNNVMTTSKTNKTLSSSTSTKSLKDNAAKIEGTYIGEGTLRQGNDEIETYNNISITIKKKSKDIVLVNVYEADGSKFFASDGEYTIQKSSNGKFSLTLKGIKNATIEIDTQNNLVYLHPRVNIDNEIYTLSINAKKN